MSDQMVTFRDARQLTGLLGATRRWSRNAHLEARRRGGGHSASMLGELKPAPGDPLQAREDLGDLTRVGEFHRSVHGSRLVATVPNATSNDRSPTRTNAPWHRDLSASSPCTSTSAPGSSTTGARRVGYLRESSLRHPGAHSPTMTVTGSWLRATTRRPAATSTASGGRGGGTSRWRGSRALPPRATAGRSARTPRSGSLGHQRLPATPSRGAWRCAR